jgi:N-acetyl-gamma-glutamylphosphate reductase
MSLGGFGALCGRHFLLGGIIDEKNSRSDHRRGRLRRLWRHELLIGHPNAEIVALFDKQDIGRPISDLYPHLRGFCDLPLLDPGDLSRPEEFDVVFFSTPDGVGQKEATYWLNKNIKVVDYSGDFRFNNAESYQGYAVRIGKNQEHASPGLLPEAVYGLAELHRKEIATARVVGNPGCFAVSCILGSAPAFEAGLVKKIRSFATPKQASQEQARNLPQFSLPCPV